MIIYFTGTGNSRYVANRLGGLLNDEVIDAFPYLQERQPQQFVSDKPYVFVCPTYAWRTPAPFFAWIKKSRFCGCRKVYFVMTCGSDIGNAGFYQERLCDKKHMEFMGVAKVVMPENYIAMFKAPDEEHARCIISKSEKAIRKLVPMIQDEIPLECPGGLIADIKTRVVYPIFQKYFVKSKAFYATEACDGCGLCESVCVMKNISLKNGLPKWDDDCIHCMACICKCPNEAIEYGKKSQGRVRYLCPESGLEDLLPEQE